MDEKEAVVNGGRRGVGGHPAQSVWTDTEPATLRH
jgi:hypothetical protein